jgi:hypothetical protein
MNQVVLATLIAEANPYAANVRVPVVPLDPTRYIVSVLIAILVAAPAMNVNVVPTG